jgi:hypothetical protein
MKGMAEGGAGVDAAAVAAYPLTAPRVFALLQAARVTHG